MPSDDPYNYATNDPLPAWAQNSTFESDNEGPKFYANVSDKIDTIKYKIQQEEGDWCAPMIQRLRFGSSLLAVGRTLSDYGIDKDATLHLNLQPSQATLGKAGGSSDLPGNSEHEEVITC